MSSQFTLLKTRRFGPFFGTQFLSAFNDNLFKNALIVPLTFQASQVDDAKVRTARQLGCRRVHSAFFPFLGDCGPVGGQIRQGNAGASRQVLEIGIMLISGACFQLHSIELSDLPVPVFGSHSTMLPDLSGTRFCRSTCKRDELNVGGKLIEAGTFVAILLVLCWRPVCRHGENGTHWITPSAAWSWPVWVHLAVDPGRSRPTRRCGETPTPSRDMAQHRKARENRTAFLFDSRHFLVLV